MRVGGNMAAITDEPVVMVNIERFRLLRALRLLEDFQQHIFVIGFSCGQQPLILRSDALTGTRFCQYVTYYWMLPQRPYSRRLR
jgi:hypothetical protein